MRSVSLRILGFRSQSMKGLVKLKLVNKILTVKSRVVGGCLMVTEVMTCNDANDYLSLIISY